MSFVLILISVSMIILAVSVIMNTVEHAVSTWKLKKMLASNKAMLETIKMMHERENFNTEKR